MIDQIDFERYSWQELSDTQLGADYAAYRGWVYVSVKHFREPDVLDLRGGESDEYDPHSHHFIAREKQSGKIIGCMRVIRNSPELSLPVFHHFPNALQTVEHDPLLITEVSRFISTAGSPRLRRDVALLLIGELAAYSFDLNQNHVVFVVERTLSRWLKSLSVPLEAIDEERWVEEEQGDLTPYIVDLKECDRALAAAHDVYAVSDRTSPSANFGP